MVCKKCGAELDNLGGFCSNCGAKTDETAENVSIFPECAVEKSAVVTKKKKIIIIAAAVVVVITAVVLFLFLYVFPNMNRYKLKSEYADSFNKYNISVSMVENYINDYLEQIDISLKNKTLLNKTNSIILFEDYCDRNEDYLNTCDTNVKFVVLMASAQDLLLTSYINITDDIQAYYEQLETYRETLLYLCSE